MKTKRTFYASVITAIAATDIGLKGKIPMPCLNLDVLPNRPVTSKSPFVIKIRKIFRTTNVRLAAVPRTDVTQAHISLSTSSCWPLPLSWA